MSGPTPPRPIGGAAQARQALAEALREWRGPDPAGALAALDVDEDLRALLAQWPSPAPEELWERMTGRVRELAEAQRCLGCGTCCRTSSPTLYRRDLFLIREGRLPLESLYTLRAGEMGSSARLGRTVFISAELIKLSEGPQGGCLHLRDSRCGLYQARPLQCRHLECWSGRHAGQLEDEPRLTRAEVLADDARALQMMAEYEIKLPADQITDTLTQAAKGDARARGRVLAALELDHRLRAAITQRYGYSLERLELILGRDLIKGGPGTRPGAGGGRRRPADACRHIAPVVPAAHFPPAGFTL